MDHETKIKVCDDKAGKKRSVEIRKCIKYTRTNKTEVITTSSSPPMIESQNCECCHELDIFLTVIHLFLVLNVNISFIIKMHNYKQSKEIGF